MFFNYISAEDLHKRRLQGDILNENNLKVLERKEFNPLFFLMQNFLNQGKSILLCHNILLLHFFGQ